MERQLRMGGGIMNVTPRQQYGLGSFIKKAVKGVTKGVKKIAGSKLGKAALLGAGIYGLGGGTFFGNMLPGITRGGQGFGGFGGLSSILGNVGNIAGGTGLGDKFAGLATGKGASILGYGAITAASALAAAGVPENQVPNDVGALRSYLKSGYLKLNPNLDYSNEEDRALVDNFVQENSVEGMADGGRIGYADGSEDMILPMRKPRIEEEMMSSNPGAAESGNPISRNEPIAALIEKYNTYNKAMPGVADETKTYLMEDFKKSLEDSGISIEEFNMRLQEQNEMEEPVDMAYGGRMGYAFGTDSPENNAIQAAGIEGLPLNQNPAGVTELDLRDSGGFIPPVGVKEKADDIPAMLANNEFVFTADAVRGMGDGSINKGAQRMYNMMKKLEKGGRV